jgi:HSP20 family protein
MANRDLTPWRQGAPAGFSRDPFAQFRREMDRLFDDFFAPAEARSFASGEPGGVMVTPTIDVNETDKSYVVTAELAGVDQKDIELSLHDNALTLRGEKRSERSHGDGGRRYSERSFGRFQRTIPFETEVDAEKVEARCENGVLTVTLPKNAKAHDKTRRIEIRGAGASRPAAPATQANEALAKGGGAPGESPPPVAGA